MSAVTYNTLKGIAKKYGLHNKRDIDMFDDLWEVYQIGNKYKRDHEKQLKNAVDDAYGVLTDIVTKRSTTGPHGFKRVAETRDDKLVIFSDHHITHRGHRHDYFHEFNYKTYLDVLGRYAENGFSLVENGDVEELIVFEPTKEETKRRRKLVRRPHVVDDIGKINWDELVGYRIETRKVQLERILNDNHEYYDLVKEKFGKSRYYKISGNHDTYDSGELEGMIESAYWDGVIKDILLVERKVHPRSIRSRSVPYFAITHGHQFDEACVPPFATQVGEVISECLSWAFQGADRIWKTSDTRKWNSDSNKEFNNALAGSRPAQTPSGHPDLEAMLEGIMGHEVAWEYFENRDPYMAFIREVCTGDEFFKYRHMNENALANAIMGPWSELEVFPTLICGHTHEPRHHSQFTRSFHVDPLAIMRGEWEVPDAVTPLPDTDNPNIFTRYMNTGSAGRFENLMWCVEIKRNAAKVYSWSNSGTTGNIKLRKVRWDSDENGKLIGTEINT